MDKRTGEAVRYLGYGNHAVDEETLALVESSFLELSEAADKRIVYRIFDLHTPDDGQVFIDDYRIDSRHLFRNLRGCEKVVLLGATLGGQVDLQIRRAALTEMARAAVMQACAAALLEEYLDGWQEEFGREMKEKGWYLRPRFSPGYGDFSVLCQKQILRMLDAPRKIGLTMTDGYMLTPSKSVTAVIGIGGTDLACQGSGCEECEKKDCTYRRNAREC